jgi:hypothetical protein
MKNLWKQFLSNFTFFAKVQLKRRNRERNAKKSAKFGIFGEQKVRMK